jgi:hypothetical protein
MQTTDNAGTIRRIRDTKNAANENFWLSRARKICEEIRYPEITKKTSTPENPPLKPGMPKWNPSTDKTA